MMNFLLATTPWTPPKGFTLFGREIAFYGVIIAVAILVAIFLTSYIYKKKGGNEDDIFTAAWFVVPLGIIGARIFHVISEWDYYGKQDFWTLFKVWEGGIAIMGGVIGGALGVLIYALIFKKNFFKLADAVAPSVAIAQAIGRWGNYFNQELYGKAVDFKLWPLSVYIVDEGAYHLGVFFIESMANFAICAVLLLILWKLDKKHLGIVVGLYVFLYGLVRFFVEPLRLSGFSQVGGLHDWQIYAIVFMVIGLGIVVWRAIPLFKEKFVIEKVQPALAFEVNTKEPIKTEIKETAAVKEETAAAKEETIVRKQGKATRKTTERLKEEEKN